MATALRHTLRRLLRAPLFSGISLLTLAVGLGATTAIFAVVRGVLLEPLPYPDSDELVAIQHDAPGIGMTAAPASDATYLLYREETRAFAELALYRQVEANLGEEGRPERVQTAVVSEGLLPMLGVAPALGRALAARDVAPGAPPVAVLADGFWRHRFGGDPGVLGRTVRLDGVPREVIGVLPAGVAFPDAETDVYLPATLSPATANSARIMWELLGRLRPGTTLESAAADVARMIPLVPERYPGLSAEVVRQGRFAPHLVPLREQVLGDAERVLWLVLAAIGTLLVVACANVANLVLVRADTRQREIALRTALGGGRTGLALLFVGELLVLALAAGGLGLLLGRLGLAALLAWAPEFIPRLDEVGLGAETAAAGLALAAAIGLGLGFLPALGHLRPALVPALKEGGRGGSAGRERLRGRNVLVAGQVALALVLLVGAGLLLRSFDALSSVDAGFNDPYRLLTFRVTLAPAEVPDDATAWNLEAQMIERLGSLPGVRSAAAVDAVPMEAGGPQLRTALLIEDAPLGEGQLPDTHRVKRASHGYFETMGIPLLDGREFHRTDHENAAPVAVVNRSFAQRYWGGQSAVGRRIRVSADEGWSEIVGVVGDVRVAGLEQPPEPLVYFPLVRPASAALPPVARGLALVARTGGPPLPLLPEAQRAIWEVAPTLPLANPRSVADIVAASVGRTSFLARLMLVAALVTLFLAAVGIYGVVSYTVQQRTREIGVRMAVGAARAEVLRLVLRHGAALTAAGAAAGLVGAVVATPVLSGLLYGVRPLDLATYVGVTVVLAVVALAAVLVPARRASNLDPTEALRFE